MRDMKCQRSEFDDGQWMIEWGCWGLAEVQRFHNRTRDALSPELISKIHCFQVSAIALNLQGVYESRCHRASFFRPTVCSLSFT